MTAWRGTWARLAIAIALVGMASAKLGAQQDHFVTISTLKCRTLAMGGASAAVRDDLGALAMNPAAVELYAAPKSFRVTFFLNPLGPVVGLSRRQDLDDASGSADVAPAAAAATLLKGVAVTISALEVLLSWGEETPGFGPREHGPEAFQMRDYFKAFENSLAARVRLAPQVALGAGIDLWQLHTGGKRLWQAGFSYGVLVQPDPRVSVGLVYVELPDSFAHARETLDRIRDESLNLGLCWRPFAGTLLSADLRNIGEEGDPLTRELHLGAEQVVLRHFALRGGMYREKDSKRFAYSAGLGLVDFNVFVAPERQFAHATFAVNYALVYRETGTGPDRWHLLSALLRL
ncbi:MAG: hypothetical protein H5U38_00890 [Calditrichaeota bacterium]|nr:hypothetical protein [Calditrichota bacterium]